MSTSQGFKTLLWLEGNVRQVYKDTAGHNTVCMGVRTNEPVGKKFTVKQCDAMNIEYWDMFRNDVSALVTKDIEEHQLDAFTLLAYNIGINGFKKSSALKAFNRGSQDFLVAANIQKWNKSRVNGVLQVDDILVKRRSVEAAIFQSADYASKARTLAASGAPKAYAPDSDGLLSIFKNSKTSWSSSAVGVLSGGAGFFSSALDKIHPLTVNLILLTVFGLAVYLLFNRFRDSIIGDHF